MSEVTQQKSGGISSSGLPVKITGIVFWGMVLVGLLIAFIMLESKGRELEAQKVSSAALIGRELVEHIRENHSPILPIKNIQDEFLQVFNILQPILHFEAIELASQSDKLLLGQKSLDQEVISSTLIIDSVEGKAAVKLQMTVFFPSMKKTAMDYRKQILISIGLMVVVFGLILQRILHSLLTQPFFSMVASAKKFAEGNIAARFDEKLGDEFGFLAKFINRALDSVAEQQEKLREALARMTQSEVALSSEKERAEVTLQSITDAVITTNASGKVEYLNPVAERLTGWNNKEAHGFPVEKVLRLVHESNHEEVVNPVHECLKINGVAVMGPHTALLQRSGLSLSVEASAAPMRNREGEIIGVVMVCQDVSTSRKLSLQLSYQASHDSLTGLFNRLKFEEQLNQLLADMEGQSHHALLYLDLDQFKIVNDTCGHIAGDELLRQIAGNLKKRIRQGDVLARLGGDEFGILLRNCNLERATAIADKILKEVKEFRFAWDDKTFEIGTSIGVAEITSDNLNAANIMSAADMACYAAKDMGRNRVHVYQPTDIGLLKRHGEMNWTTLITQALEQDRFVLYAQPIMAIGNAGGSGYHWEILLRMKDKDGGIIPPNTFIPAAERYNKMLSIDRWVVRNVFSAIAKGCFSTAAGSTRVIAINLSGASLGDDGMLDYICASSSEFGISLNEICFEVTETVAISNLTKATHFINDLKSRGCRFSLDDFGSGLSSFGYLKNLPVDYIKIDGSFVKDMVTDPIDRAMVEAINQIGHVMQIQTIAEWVENEETLSLLKQIGVNYAQGYHTGKPAPVLLPS
jgi:diguanylate cyclase (GGDEF)-like protein/PAS domain S-box-containing protein